MIPGIDPVVLSTPRLVLRPYADEHADGQHAAAVESMATVGRWMTWCHPAYRREDGLAWIRKMQRAWQDGEEFAFAVFDGEARFVGSAGINQIHPLHGFANLGYWIRESAQRRGYAVEAVRAVARFGFDALKLTRLEIVVAEGNEASRRVALRAGARPEGVARNRLVIHGALHAAAIHSLVPGDLG